MKNRHQDDRRSRRSKRPPRPEGASRRPPGPRMVREDWTWEENRFREIVSAHRASAGTRA
jgi:hypothetical protein